RPAHQPCRCARGDCQPLRAWSSGDDSRSRQTRGRHRYADEGAQVMTLPKDVQDAMSDAGKCAAEIGGFAPWESIRAHLLSQDAEIERRFGIGGELIIARRERDALQSRLATADALLREL